MTEYNPDTYGNRAAEFYDALVAARVDSTTQPAAAFLAELSGVGTALELGIGTGRVALPLAARGTRVHGIDSSEAMVAQMRAKPGGAEIQVAFGDSAARPAALRLAERAGPDGQTRRNEPGGPLRRLAGGAVYCCQRFARLRLRRS